MSLFLMNIIGSSSGRKPWEMSRVGYVGSVFLSARPISPPQQQRQRWAKIMEFASPHAVPLQFKVMLYSRTQSEDAETAKFS
jgi:hypothetical protein